MTQRKIWEKVTYLLTLQAAVAEHVRCLREDVREMKKKVDERYAPQIAEFSKLYDKYSKDLESFQKRCRNTFHREKGQYGRCPDCNLFRRDPREK